MVTKSFVGADSCWRAASLVKFARRLALMNAYLGLELNQRFFPAIFVEIEIIKFKVKDKNLTEKKNIFLS